MGREIRKVPQNWEHPQKEYGNNDYIPLYDLYFPVAASEWLKNCILWSKGKHPSQRGEYASSSEFYWEYDYPPQEEECRSYKDAEATWFQVYETVSEGTPTTPPFATEQELIEYLVKNGEDTGIHDQPWKQEVADRFVLGDKYCLSFAVIGGRIIDGPEISTELDKTK